MKLRFLLAQVAAFALASGSALANSYAFGPLPKEELPEKADKFSSRVTLYGKEQTSRLTRDSLDQFLQHGTWHYQNPYYAEMKKLGPEWEKYYLYQKLPEAERTEKQKQILQVYSTYFQKPEIQGAFTNQEGRVFLYRLRSPQFLEIQSGGICYLFRETGIPLAPTREDRALTEVPKIEVGTQEISRGPLPATGSFSVIPKNVVEAFLEEGTVSDRRIDTWRRHPSELLTSYWLEDSPLVRTPTFELKHKDRAGNWLLGATVNGVFPGNDEHLWFCELLSDALLLLDNGKGQYLIVEHPEAVARHAGERE